MSPTLPAEIDLAASALRADVRVRADTLDLKLDQIRSHLGGKTVHGAARAQDIGAELRGAVYLLRKVPEIEVLLFPPDDPPDIELRFQSELISIEVIRLAVQSAGANSDTALAQAEQFTPDLLATCSEEHADWFVWNQLRGKLRKVAKRGRSANILLLVSDSATVKWTLVGSVGAWRAVAGAAVDDEVVPFGDVVVWYGGPFLNETPRHIGANRAHQTAAARALISRAFAGIGPHLLAGPGDDGWDREQARRELHHAWEIDDRGRRRSEG